MPAMRITEAQATPAQVEAARKQAHGGGMPLPINSIGAALLGSGMIAAAFKFFSTVGTAAATVGAVTGLVLLVVGGLGLFTYGLSFGFHRAYARLYAPVTEQGRVVVIEIEAAHVYGAESIDDDADALVLCDGEGGGVYINSHQLFEVAPSDEDTPTRWRIVATAREGVILAVEADGSKVKQRTSGPHELPFEPEALDNDLGYEVVVLPARGTPEEWRKLLIA